MTVRYAHYCGTLSILVEKTYHNSAETASQPCTIVINKLLVGERAVLCGKKTSHLHKKKQHASKVCLHTCMASAYIP